MQKKLKLLCIPSQRLSPSVKLYFKLYQRIRLLRSVKEGVQKYKTTEAQRHRENTKN
jgi:hypothetical protein